MLIKEHVEIYPENKMENINAEWEHSSVLLLLELHFRGLQVIDDAVNTILLYAIYT